MGAMIVSSAVTLAQAYVGLGLTVGVIGIKGANIYRKFRLDSANPYAFLSKVKRTTDQAGKHKLIGSTLELASYAQDTTEQTNGM